MDVLDTVIEKICAAYSDVIAIYIFGSFESTFERGNSDLDVAVLCEGSLDNVQRWQLAQEIAIAIDRNVDLVDLSAASTVLQFQVLDSNKCIYCADTTRCAQFESTVDSMYLRLKELRSGIIDDVKDRGEIYDND